MMVHKDNGGRRKMVPCRHCPLFLARSRDSDNGGSADKRRQSRWQCLGIVGHSLPFSVGGNNGSHPMMGATTKVVAVRTKVHWHRWAFLAVTHDRGNWSSVSNDAQGSNAVTGWMVVSWNFAHSLPCCVVATTSAVQNNALWMTAANNNGCRVEDGALVA
jgi:hypothetical protein